MVKAVVVDSVAESVIAIGAVTKTKIEIKIAAVTETVTKIGVVIVISAVVVKIVQIFTQKRSTAAAETGKGKTKVTDLLIETKNQRK